MGLAALAGILVAAAPLANRYLNHPEMPRPIDFLAFWAAGKLHLNGESPYDPMKVWELQAANRTSEDHPVVIWNPPWLLALLLPIGALSVNAAQVAWILGQMVLIGAGVAALWKVYGGPTGRTGVQIALVLGSGPFWWQAVCGQADGLVFAGLAGFLLARHFDRPYLAGAAAALTAVKPHLLIFFAIGLGIDTLRTRAGRQVVVGGLAAIALAAAVATIPNPGIWADYLGAASGPGSEYYPKLSEWFNPTLGAWVRKAVPGDPFWVQMVPTAIAAVGFAVYWWRRGGPDRWAEVLPWAVPLGLLTPPYGSWPCDLVLLLLPATAVAARLAREGVPVAKFRIPLAVYAAANLGVVVMLVTKQRQELYVWACPVIAASLLWASYIGREDRTA
jgi:hypothetical protein